MSILPVITGFGGINAAGRSSFHHGYRRMVIDVLEEKTATETYLNLSTMMGLLHYKDGKFFDQEEKECLPEEVKEKFGEEIHKGSLIRRVIPERYDADRVYYHKPMTLQSQGENNLVFSVSKKDLPNEIPENWVVTPLEGKEQVSVRVQGEVPVFLKDYRKALVQSAGQMPTGFDPGALYPSAHHPMALKMTVIGASDAVSSLGIDWKSVLEKVSPDQVGVYASSAMGQMDEHGAGGYARASLLGKRPNSKQMPLSFAEMTADFINAYIVGNVGHTSGVVAACSTFLYNLNVAMEEIRSGRRRVAIVGASEGAILPHIVEGYRVISALGEDTQLLELDRDKGAIIPDYARACRPFGQNCGFTLAESAQFVILFDDQLALELGAEVYGSVGSVFINADGFKKSISRPGVGNYITLAKALSLGRKILGEKALQNHTFVQAHGTGTPANRASESKILNDMSALFGISRWPVSAIKTYVGHSTGPAAGDQLIPSLGVWKYGWIPGIFTLDTIPEDVTHTNLILQKNHLEVGPDSMEAVFVNSKAFGGNNATGMILSPNFTLKMMEKKHGKQAIQKYYSQNEKVKENAESYDQETIKNNFQPIYNFGKGIVEEDQLEITDQYIKIPGFKNQIDLDIPNPYEDMID